LSHIVCEPASPKRAQPAASRAEPDELNQVFLYVRRCGAERDKNAWRHSARNAGFKSFSGRIEGCYESVITHIQCGCRSFFPCAERRGFNARAQSNAAGGTAGGTAARSTEFPGATAARRSNKCTDAAHRAIKYPRAARTGAHVGGLSRIFLFPQAHHE